MQHVNISFAAAMDSITLFEDLSTELILEVFEYLHALDLFTAFSSLNNRFSSILFLPDLHVIVNDLHCHHQMKLLSSHLTDHTDQVISISLQDQLRDFSSVISYLFDRYTFENLHSCKFHSICQSINLDTILTKLQSCNQLVSFQIIQPKNLLLSDEIKQELSNTVLKCNSLNLRVINLSFSSNYRQFLGNNLINSILTSLQFMFHGSMTTCMTYTLLPILRIYRALRLLRVHISNHDNLSTQPGTTPTLPDSYITHPPISPSLRTLELCISTFCDFRSLHLILRCLHNLRRFIISIYSFSSLPRSMLDGAEWERLLANGPTQLDVLDIFLQTKYSDFQLDTSIIINSFDYFTRKYDDWYVAVHQSQNSIRADRQQNVSLHGFRRSKSTPHFQFNSIHMLLGTLNIHSTMIGDDDHCHHLFYSMFKHLYIKSPTDTNTFNIPCTNQVFKNIDSLTIEMDSTMPSLWKDLLDFFHIRCTTAAIRPNGSFHKITSLVDLTHISKLEFNPAHDTSQLHLIKDVLVASPRVIQLTISDVLFFSPVLYDDSSLISVFDRLQSLYLRAERTGFHFKYAKKLVERCSSLVHLEFEVYYSIDYCICLLDVFLDGLPKLMHVRIHFRQNTLLGDGTCWINHIIKRRQQAFPHVLCNKDEVTIKINLSIMNVHLTGCSICAARTCVL